MSQSQFSGALQLTNINDYLGPSQECTKPIEVPKSASNQVSRIEIGSDGSYNEVRIDGTQHKLQKAKITLADCLACSGCVTTAESVLVEAQSVSEFLRVLKKDPKATGIEKKPRVFIVSVSSQTLASMAATCSISMSQAYLKLNTLFSKNFGCDYFFDISFAREIALLESANEFLKRFENKTNLPLLASACPGWICYAEKNQGNDILPYISQVKSPQQIMGSLVKKHFVKIYNQKHNLTSEEEMVKPNDVYHITLMPCWDKKLEASRRDFYDDITRANDVDLVLTTIEIPQLLEEANISSFNDIPLTPIANPLFNNISDQQGEFKVIGVSGTSGSFAEYIFKTAAKQIFGEKIETVEFKTVVRPRGMKEVKLIKDGKTLLSFATAYGFSNIANIVKQIKSGNCKYHYIEVMACPSGCLNGGGQLKADSVTTKTMTSKELLALVEKSYNEDQIMELEPEKDPKILELYKDLECQVGDDKAKALFCTQYHAIEKTEKNPLTIQW